ncbi:hypothetical protein PENTCL1PPCAC_12908, partial [Pristionchus entomophagus]
LKNSTRSQPCSTPKRHHFTSSTDERTPTMRKSRIGRGSQVGDEEYPRSFCQTSSLYHMNRRRHEGKLRAIVSKLWGSTGIVIDCVSTAQQPGS